MKNYIDYEFKFEFSGKKDFVDCFSSAYKYLTESDEKLSKYSQCDWLFFFGTMSGQNMTRLPYDETETETEWLVANTDTQIDLIWGFSAYDYKVITQNFKDEIIISINAGKPVIAKLKGQVSDCFRLINGHDGGTLLCPNSDVSYDEIEYLHIFGEKTARRYSLIDGLKQMKKILDYNREKDYWSIFIQKFFGYFDEQLNEKPVSEVKKRFDRAVTAMWHTFNCHNLGCAMNAEWFQDILAVENVKQYEHAFGLIGDACFTTHLLAWIPIEINKLIDWSNREGRTYNDTNSEWALGNAIAEAVQGIDNYDKMLSEAINEMIEITK